MSETVLITGASSGIGLELSILFAKKGYNLVMVSQRKENLEKAKMLVGKENCKVKILTIAKDLGEASAPKEIFEYTKDNSIHIDILVNNAGIQVYGNFHNAAIEDTINLMYVNMFALTELTKLYVDEMVKVGRGKILNLASTGAFQPCPLNAIYCASKAFVLSFSEAIGEELKGTGVSVTTLCPGATRTNFAKRAHIEGIKLFSGRLIEPNKVALIGYNALMKKKTVVVTGIYNKLLTQSVRFIPRNIIIKIGGYMMRK